MPSPLPAPAARCANWVASRAWAGRRILLAVLLLAVFAPWVAPHDPLEQDLLHMLTPPMWASGGDAAFPLGTDGLGRCVLSRAIYGSRVALTVAIVAALGSMLLGSTLAMLGGYFGGVVDARHQLAWSTSGCRSRPWCCH